MSHTSTALLTEERHNELRQQGDPKGLALLEHVFELLNAAADKNVKTPEATQLYTAFRDAYSWFKTKAVIAPAKLYTLTLSLINEVERQVNEANNPAPADPAPTSPPAPTPGTPVPAPSPAPADDSTAPSWFTSWSTEQGTRLTSVEQALNGTDDEPGITAKVDTLWTEREQNNQEPSFWSKLFGTNRRGNHNR